MSALPTSTERPDRPTATSARPAAPAAAERKVRSSRAGVDATVLRVVPPAPDVPRMTLQEIVDRAPRWVGPDQHTMWQFFAAVLSMLAVALLFGTAGGFVLYAVLARVLAYLN